MIKHAKYLLIFMCLFMLDFRIVDAAKDTCSSSVKKDLAYAAALVKANTEIKDFSEEKTLEVDGSSTTYKIPNYAFEISIYNVSDDIRVLVETTKEDRNMIINNSQTTDDVYTFTDDNFGEIYNYVLTVESAHPDCYGMTLRTIKFTKPRYNPFSEFTYCKNSTNYYCQRFIGTEISVKSVDDFLDKISVNNEKNNPDNSKPEDKKEIANLVKKYWKTYLIIFIVILIITVVVIVYVHNRKKKKGWRL